MKVQVKNNPRDLYVTGRVRFLEKELFDQARFGRLSENSSREELAGDLSDSRYGAGVKEYGLEAGLSRYFHEVFVFMKDNISHPDALCLFFAGTDIMNFINRVRGVSEDEIYEPGVFGAGWLPEGSLPGFFKEASGRILRDYSDIAAAPDSFIEKTCRDLARERFLPGAGSGAVSAYHAAYTDINNLLMNLLHSSPFYWEGGHIKAGEWKNIDVKKGLSPKLAARTFMRSVENEKDYSKWEDILTKTLSSRLKDMRKITFGIEAAVSYFLSIAEEIRNLRIIIAGIDTKAGGADIKERLNFAYI